MVALLAYLSQTLHLDPYFFYIQTMNVVVRLFTGRCSLKSSLFVLIPFRSHFVWHGILQKVIYWHSQWDFWPRCFYPLSDSGVWKWSIKLYIELDFRLLMYNGLILTINSLSDIFAFYSVIDLYFIALIAHFVDVN